jgi:collagenase-like PrtC family protease
MSVQPRRLCVPCSFVPGELENLAALRQGDSAYVLEVYGALNPAPHGTGRASRTLPLVTPVLLRETVATARRFNINFNYTLNSAADPRRDFSAVDRRQTATLVDNLLDLGIKHFTVASPALIQFLAQEFPEAEICASAILRIDSPGKAKFFEDLGAKRLILFEDINRDFRTLRFIARACSAALEVMVNTPCSYGCPIREFHYSTQGVAGELGADADIAAGWFLRCNHWKLDRPEELLRAPGLVRPEDLDHYQARGIGHFKLVGREAAFTNTLQVAKAYIHGNWDGNVFDLFARREGTRQAFHIENSSLTDLLKPFLQGKAPCTTGCVECGHCDSFVPKFSEGVTQDDVVAAKAELSQRFTQGHFDAS